MEEFKIFFDHKEALEILQKFEAVFIIHKSGSIRRHIFN